MARAMWKGTLQLDKLRVPVKLYAAVQDHDVHFRLLHAKDKVPVQQQMVSARTGKPVPPDQVRRGMQVEEGVFVVLSKEELKELDPPASRIIEVTRMVSPDAIDLSWYNRPYYLGPDDSESDYFALADALRRSGRIGLVRWVMRGNWYFGALRDRDGYLAIVALHSVDEAVPADQLKAPAGGTVSDAERKLAEQLIETLDSEFDPGSLHDDYRERVEKLIEAKGQGRKYRVKEGSPPRPAADLTSALKKSLQAVREKQHA